MEDIQVLKREGGIENWNYDKTLSSIIKVGLDYEKAEQISKKIEKWVEKTAKNNVIKSTAIRDKIIELLMAYDPLAANSYKAYKLDA
ncbi:MAG: ATP cone domain-containing protein [Patescibacteria group bacterium]